MVETFIMTKKERLKYFKDKVSPALNIKHLVEVKEFAPNSFRLTSDDGIVIDYFPKSSKVFIHKTRKWFIVLDKKMFNSLQELLNLKV